MSSNKPEESTEVLDEGVNNHLQIILDNLPVGVTMADLETGILETCNPALAELVKRTPEEIVGKHQSFLHTGEEVDIPTETFKQHSCSENLHLLESELTTSDGERIAVEISAKKVIINGRERVLGIFTDITEHKQAKEALRYSKERYERLFESSRDSLMTLEPPLWLFTSGNSATCKMFGAKDNAEFISCSPWQLSPEYQPDGTLSADKAKEMIKTSIREGSHFFEWTHKRLNGEEFPATVLLTCMEINGETIVQATVRDITEHRKAEEEKARLETALIQAQKMESIGRLAGGVAHDFNNLLTVISCNVKFAQEDIDHSDPLNEVLNDISGATDRASNLTRQLLAFSRKQDIQPKVIDLDELIVGLHKMLKRTIKENIEISIVPMREQGKISVDPGQMEQIIVNLVVNAADAMPKGGKIDVKTAVVNLDDEFCRRCLNINSGNYVMLTISDTGEGIDEDMKNNIFEPFFTTKDKSKGTGLGLATVHGIVKQHGGHIEMESKVGEGTIFKIYFPLVQERISKSVSRIDTIDEIPMGTETVLIAEDEPMVLKIATRMLKGLGYKVFSAVSGKDALQIAGQEGVSIDLLLTDVIMPGMDGHDLAIQMNELRPDIPVIFTSGYTDEIINNEQGVIDEGLNFISKPYTRRCLAVSIRDALDKKKELLDNKNEDDE